MDFFEMIIDFLEKGGQVLWLIFFTLLVMWFFIMEKYYYFHSIYPQKKKLKKEEWLQRSDRTSWFARRIREMEISKMNSELNCFIPTIKVLVMIAPLLGLLGTVTGMIAVFDVMALTGTGNARLMASGISLATIPTMAGMVSAISGLYFGSYFEKKARFETQKFKEVLLLS